MNKIFWGLILVFFDFNIGSVSILPAFIGYILIALGMLDTEGAPAFGRAKPWCIAAAVLSAVFWLPIITEPTVLTLVALAGSALQLAVLYFLTEGMGELAALHRIDLNYGKLRKYWKIMAVCIAIAEVGGLMQFNLAVIALIPWAVAAIVYLVNFRRTGKALLVIA